jgi:hypothetical protein
MLWRNRYLVAWLGSIISLRLVVVRLATHHVVTSKVVIQQRLHPSIYLHQAGQPSLPSPPPPASRPLLSSSLACSRRNRAIQKCICFPSCKCYRNLFWKDKSTVDHFLLSNPEPYALPSPQHGFCRLILFLLVTSLHSTVCLTACLAGIRASWTVIAPSKQAHPSYLRTI